MLFPVLMKKAFARNLQYRLSHAVNTVASIVFGLIYVSIWQGIGQQDGMHGYSLQTVIHYVALNQATLWVTLFVTNGLGIERSVRTGQIATDLMRPVHLFYQLMCREWGQIGYQLLYKTIPIYLIYIWMLSIPVPHNTGTWLAFTTALAMAAYMNICVNYLIGVTALWTTESTWLFWVHNSISSVLSGFLIPIEWLPQWLQRIAYMTPYPYMQYIPSKIYLGLASPSEMYGGLLWCVLFTALCLAATAIVRNKVEVQGG
ncbi:hypothetical protein QJ48_13170 [Paenibacillus sp. A3]|uniref:ABC transporter permease n=1 Tax=Paenibacillus sp. A3 TaxID=1337054 RepID=UPI0006D57AFA|nr:ABC-2 family transporter protein [Paenibacillus sp. A3]KPV59033.1 hypothetical protein QJ48_13170 [Paenibacillus sp. A3]